MYQNRYPICGLILMVGMLAGCQANPSGRTPVVVGGGSGSGGSGGGTFAGSPEPVGDRGAPDVVDMSYVEWSGSGPLSSNTPIVTATPVTFEFLPANSAAGATYSAFVAPLPGATLANCRVVPPPAPTAYGFDTPEGDAPPTPPSGDISYGMLQPMGQNPEFRIFVGSGYALYSGARPHGETGTGEVTSDGTWLIIKTGAAFDRFFLLHADPGKSMTVKASVGLKQSRNVTQLLHYVDVTPAGSVTAPTAIPVAPGDPIFQFVNQAVQAASAAGITGPPNWPPPLF